MPNFKPKAKKKIKVSKNATVTVDNKHQEKMDEFKNLEENIIPSLKIKQKKLKKKLKYEDLNLEEQLESKDELKIIKKQIKNYEQKKKKYLLDNSKYVFEYYENKKGLVIDNNSKTKVLHSFFKKNKNNNDEKKTRKLINNSQKYLTNIDESFLNINNYIQSHEVCSNCSGELIPVESEGVMICKKCSQQVNFLIEHEKPSYKEPPKEVCFYAYKRINHFREILAQFQAKETTQIPEEVLTNIISQIKKERITLDAVSNKKAKDILKKLGYNKYYEHIPFIKDKLGIRPPIMKPRLEEKLCSLFMDIQKPYAKHCPDDRVNFLNYYYVLYKMCELLGETQFLPFFPMLKDPVKRIEQDEIWKKICAELHWEFIPTI
jgi:ribosomal protein L37AE/L43A